jgi:hypothetical protein
MKMNITLNDGEQFAIETAIENASAVQAAAAAYFDRIGQPGMADSMRLSQNYQRTVREILASKGMVISAPKVSVRSVGSQAVADSLARMVVTSTSPEGTLDQALSLAISGQADETHAQ